MLRGAQTINNISPCWLLVGSVCPRQYRLLPRLASPNIAKHRVRPLLASIRSEFPVALNSHWSVNL